MPSLPNNPLATPSGPTSFQELGICRPIIPTYMQQEILNRTRVFLMDQGWQGKLAWQFLDRSNVPLDMTTVPVGAIKTYVAISPIGKEHLDKKPITLEVTYDENDSPWYKVNCPQVVSDKAGVYYLDWSMHDEAGNRVLINRSLLSVDTSQYGDKRSGPLTIQEIRTTLHDTNFDEKHLLNDIEFQPDEMVLAIVTPIREFNETPPRVARYSVDNFPYRESWKKATIAHLYRMAANHHRQNQHRVQSPGLAYVDKDKEQTYMQAAEMLLQEWRAFSKSEQVRKNMESCFSINGSQYD